jgi:DNA repair photolyase
MMRFRAAGKEGGEKMAITGSGGEKPMGHPAMRWDAQRVDAVDVAVDTLPGLARLSTLVRSVRTPEFQGVTFHEILAKSALNHVPNDARMLPGEWTINPYRGCTHACRYCYARNSHSRLELNIAEDFDSQIIVKINIVDILREELAKKRKLPPRVALGTSTDPYQRAEGRYALMPGIIDALADRRIPFSILTKGTLIRRDIDRLVAANTVTTVQLGMSISLMDEKLQQSIEPGTATTAARLATVRAIRDTGMDCTVFISPILPLLTDRPGQLDELVRAVASAGATSALYTPLYLASGVKTVFFDWLRHEHPELVRDYAGLYSNGSETPSRYREWLSGQIRPLFSKYGLPDPDDTVEDKFALHGRSNTAEVAIQPTLF